MTIITDAVAYSSRYQSKVACLGMAYDGKSLISAVKKSDKKLVIESVANIALRTLAIVPVFNTDPTLKIVLLNLNILQSGYYFYKACKESEGINKTAGIAINVAFFASQLHSLINV